MLFDDALLLLLLLLQLFGIGSCCRLLRVRVSGAAEQVAHRGKPQERRERRRGGRLLLRHWSGAGRHRWRARVLRREQHYRVLVDARRAAARTRLLRARQSRLVRNARPRGERLRREAAALRSGRRLALDTGSGSGSRTHAGRRFALSGGGLVVELENGTELRAVAQRLRYCSRRGLWLYEQIVKRVGVGHVGLRAFGWRVGGRSDGAGAGGRLRRRIRRRGRTDGRVQKGRGGRLGLRAGRVPVRVRQAARDAAGDGHVRALRRRRGHDDAVVVFEGGRLRALVARAARVDERLEETRHAEHRGGCRRGHLRGRARREARMEAQRLLVRRERLAERLPRVRVLREEVEHLLQMRLLLLLEVLHTQTRLECIDMIKHIYKIIDY